MTKAQGHKLKVGQEVTVVQRHSDGLAAWVIPMDDMLGGIYKVKNVNPNNIKLSHPFNGRDYLFSFKSIEAVKGKTAIFKSNGFVYETVVDIHIKNLKSMFLIQDYNKIVKFCDKPKKSLLTLNLNKDSFNKIKENCPRAIGVLLSWGMLVRTSEKKSMEKDNV